jgi:Ca2+-transporting ATPase
METEFGKIAREVLAVEKEETPLERRTAEIGKWLAIISLFVCVVVIGVSVAREALADTLSLASGINMLMFGVALAVAAVPEALAAIVTGALAIGMREMAKRGALVRRMPAVETLGCTTVICSDKTGTLTKGEMTVRRVCAGGEFMDVEGAGYSPEGRLSSDPSAFMPLFHASVLCNDASLMEKEGGWAIKGDPTEAALVVLAAKAGLHQDETRASRPRIAEVPFSSERKLMSTVNVSGDSRTAYAKGAPEVVLSRSDRMLGPGGEVMPLGDAERQGILEAAESMASDALRVLALAYKPVDGVSLDEEHIESGLIFAGLAGMMDPPRPEAEEAVRVCKEVHMHPVMITGDHRVTAMAVAREMGIYSEGDIALTGAELEAMSDEEFESVVEKVTVYARVSPSDKLKIVRAWRHRGEIVAMTGDGVNDAPALKHADIGIAMGISGTEVAKEAADMVLSDDNFATIVTAIERGRWIYDNIKKYLTYLLRCNITEVLVIGGVVLWMGPEFLPLLPAAILYVNLATDGLPALALGVAPPDADIMKRPPRDPSESVFSKEVRTFILLAVLIEFPAFVWMWAVSVHDMELARTRMFFMFIIIELAIAMNFRSMRYSLLKAPPHKWLVLALFWEIVLIAVLMQFPAVRESFGVGMPAVRDIALLLGFGAVIFVVMEAVKLVLRRRTERAEQGTAP